MPICRESTVTTASCWALATSTISQLTSPSRLALHSAMSILSIPFTRTPTTELNLAVLCIIASTRMSNWELSSDGSTVFTTFRYTYFVFSGDEKTSFGLASTYRISPDLLLRAKIDNRSNVGLAVTHALSPNLKATVSSLFGLTAANKENRLGFGLEFNA